jgi:riboflavin transporter FmnP
MIVLNHFTPLPCYELVMHLPCDEVIKQYNA